MRLSLLICFILLWKGVTGTPPQVGYFSESSEAFTPEGRWQAGSDGAVFEIRPRAGHSGVFDLVLLSSTDMSMQPYADMGEMKATGTQYTYDATLLAKPGKGTASKSHRFIFKFEPDFRSFTITPYRRGKQVNLLRWVPYLFRIGLSDIDTRPKTVDAAVRLSDKYSSYPIIL